MEAATAVVPGKGWVAETCNPKHRTDHDDRRQDRPPRTAGEGLGRNLPPRGDRLRRPAADGAGSWRADGRGAWRAQPGEAGAEQVRASGVPGSVLKGAMREGWPRRMRV